MDDDNTLALTLQQLSLHDYYPCVADDNCGKVFKTANEWQRHENRTHYQHECWHCEICRTVCKTREQFVEHLDEDHTDTGYCENDDYIDYRHIEANHQGNFYCGFCEDVIITVTDDGLKAWKERFNHITKHFVAGKRMEDWFGL